MSSLSKADSSLQNPISENRMNIVNRLFIGTRKECLIFLPAFHLKESFVNTPTQVGGGPGGLNIGP